MKLVNSLIIFCAILFSNVLIAQQVISSSNLSLKGINLTELKKSYSSVLTSNNEKGVNDYAEAYQTYINGFSSYCKNKGLVWSETLTGFNQILIDKNGKVAFFIYEPINGFSETDMVNFESLMLRYLYSFNFPKTNNMPIVIEGNVNYLPNN